MIVKTVGELLEALKSCPPETPVELQDPDTGWSLWLEVVVLPEEIIFSSDYGNKKEWP